MATHIQVSVSRMSQTVEIDGTIYRLSKVQFTQAVHRFAKRHVYFARTVRRYNDLRNRAASEWVAREIGMNRAQGLQIVAIRTEVSA